MAASAALFAILLFVFPYNSGDSSINSPLGFALWKMWTAPLWASSNLDAPDYSYCLLVPLMVSYLLWEKRKQIASARVQASAAGVAWIVLGLVLFWIGARAGKQYLGCIGVQILLLGIIQWFWGKAIFGKLFSTWAILLFAWPLPFLDTAVAFPLRMMVSRAAYYALNLVGVPTQQSGTALLSAPTATLPVGSRFQIDIADPCSGLHSLLPLLMFSAFFCFFFLPRIWMQWTVFISTFVFAVAGNVIRILMLVVGTLLWGMAFAIGTDSEPSQFHEGCGFAAFIIALCLVCGFAISLIKLDKRWTREAATLPDKCKLDTPFPIETSTEIPLWRSATIFGFAVLVALICFTSPPVYLPSEAGVLMSLPERVQVPNLDGGNFFGTETGASEVELRVLPKDTQFSRKFYDDFHRHHISLSIVLSGVQQYTIHPPEVCLVAQGWSIVGQEDVPITLESGHRLIVRNLSLQRDVLDRQKVRHTIKAYFMYWYVADNLTTPSHLERNLVSSWDRVVHNRDHRWAYVYAMSAITDSLAADGLDAGQTRDMLTHFIKEVVPTFQKSELRRSADNS